MGNMEYGWFLSTLYNLWIFFRYVFIVLVVAFAIGGLSDFFVDIYYWVRQIYRRLFKKRLIKPLTLDQLLSIDEKPIALMIPSWREAGIIKKMLLNTLNTIDYRNYFIFVGCYPNDPETQAEVDQVSEVYPQVIKVINSKPGPTTKADNLNEIYRGLCHFEKETGLTFDLVVLSDSEDIHHPLSFKLFNYLMPRFEMIQIPVIPLEMPWHSFVGGVYMDEFAENHLKELIVREKIARILPSAGTSTAFWRESLKKLDEANNQQIFNPKSLTEDYEIGIRLGKLGLKQIILVQWVERVVTRKDQAKPKKVRELVATRAFFLEEFRKAMRQRARWVYGIAWQGLRNIGWDRNLKVSYSLLRDRLSFFTNFLYVFGYLLIAYILTCWVAHLFRPDFAIPALVRPDEIWWKLALLVLFFFCWRILMRIVFVKKIYGLGQALLSPIRIIVGNVLNFASSTLAMLWLIRAVSTRKEQTWIKTEHAFPAEKLEAFRRKIGDLLLTRHLVTAKQLEQAVKLQKKTKKRLGQILLELGYISEEELASALAYQRQWAFVEIDPYAVEPGLLRIIPKWLAERYRIFPLKYENGVLHLAIDRIDLGLLKSSLSELMKVEVKFSLTTTYDINYAIERAYSEDFIKVVRGRRLGELLLRDNIITREQLTTALRRQKRSGQSLGEILVDEGFVEEDFLKRYLEEQKTLELRDRKEREELAQKKLEEALKKSREEAGKETEKVEEIKEKEGGRPEEEVEGAGADKEKEDTTAPGRSVEREEAPGPEPGEAKKDREEPGSEARPGVGAGEKEGEGNG
ncbi:MAG: phage adsorption protein NrfB [Candidatus Aminicenantes bacterium]|nr:phage adsorption protein NrfB [Candidatus Aminicenantes bacterium]